MKNSIEIVLVKTQLPENLGSVARGMLNFNFEKLSVIDPQFEMTNEKIIPVSAGADHVIKKSKIFSSFPEAIKNFNYVIGTTNRIRAIKKKEITLERISELIQKTNNSVAIVFGPEKSGLDNDHISLCDYVYKIETNPKFSSLNLSHAVTIICNQINYILKKKKLIKVQQKIKLLKKMI